MSHIHPKNLTDGFEKLTEKTTALEEQYTQLTHCGHEALLCFKQLTKTGTHLIEKLNKLKKEPPTIENNNTLTKAVSDLESLFNSAIEEIELFIDDTLENPRNMPEDSLAHTLVDPLLRIKELFIEILEDKKAQKAQGYKRQLLKAGEGSR